MVIWGKYFKDAQKYLVESLTGRNAGYWQDKDMSGPDDMKLNVRHGVFEIPVIHSSVKAKESTGHINS